MALHSIRIAEVRVRLPVSPSMKVIILAGGKGTRLPHSAKNIPKSLVEIAGKPILQHQLDLLKKHGLNDIRLSLGYKSAHIIDYTKGKYEYVIESQPLGTGGAIKFASKNLKEEFMVLNGDILCDINFSKFIAAHKANVSRETLGTLAVYYSKAKDFGLIRIKNNRITEFLEKPQSPVLGYQSVGFYILNPKIFENVSRETFSIEHDIFQELAKKGKLSAFIHKGFWTDLGTEERLKQVIDKMFHDKQ